MRASIMFALVGLIAFATLLVAGDPGAILRAMSSVGVAGFLILTAWQVLLYLPLGAAWRAVGDRLPLKATIWARAVRDGAGNCLPFSVIGGLVFGARSLEASAPCRRSDAVISSIVDMTLEFAAQVAFAAIGITLLLLHAPSIPALWSMLSALPVVLVLAFIAILGQTGLLKPLRALSDRIGRPYLQRLGHDIDVVAMFDRAYADPRALASGALLHLAAWLGSGVGSWIALRLLGHPVGLAGAIGIEAGVCLARAASFIVPAGLGVQEGVYIGLCALYGVPAGAALALSLLRRARELVVGLPVLLIDQWPSRPAREARARSAHDRQDWLARLVMFGDRVLDRFNYRSELPSAEKALTALSHEPGAAALQEPDLREALEQWARSLRTEANLNAIGRMGAQWDMERLLRIQCRFREEEIRDPSILAEPVEAPLFITGMPRSGSTFLHTLMAQDSGNLVPRCWQALAPYPPRAGRDRRHEEAHRQFEMFTRLSPGVSSVHLLSPDAPQECSELMAASFRSLRFDTTHNVPTYRRWLDQSGHRQAYAFLRRFLQHLQRQMGPGRWVLKCPDHVFALDALLENFPDARFVVMHRDPLKILPSATKLTELLRQPFTRSIDREALGQHVVRDWLDGAHRIMEVGEHVPADRLLHIHYSEFTDHPFDMVMKIYERFGFPIRAEEMEKIRGACERPRGGYGRNGYRFAEHGIDANAERERFRFYTDGFHVETEVILP